MARYTVTVKEVYYNTYEVNAVSEEDALRNVRDGKGVMVDDALDFSHVYDEEYWMEREVSEVIENDREFDDEAEDELSAETTYPRPLHEYEEEYDRTGMFFEPDDLVDIEVSQDGKSWELYMVTTYREWDNDTMVIRDKNYNHARIVRHQPEKNIPIPQSLVHKANRHED